MKKNNLVKVYWNDIRVYDDGQSHTLTSAYTEGVLLLDEERYIVIKDPETIIISDNKTKNHPENKPKFYYIPKSLIESYGK